MKMRHIIPISGKDSLATAVIQTTTTPALKYEFVFNPTGAELPEVIEWLERVERYLGQPIVRVGRDLDAIIQSYNYFLPNVQSRYCTRQAKIEPFVHYINGEESTVYYGIRADEEREGFNNTTSRNITPVYPLRQLGIGINHVYQILNSKGLKPPTFFWVSVYDECCRLLGFDVRKALPEWLFDMLFAWRSRTNCYFCFNQRLYELVGLLEYHPDLFDKAEIYEHRGGGSAYYWKQDYPLQMVRERAEIIKRKRVLNICRIIAPTMQLELFEEEKDDFMDILQVKSCGLFCGK